MAGKLDIAKAVEGLSGWRQAPGREALAKTFKFADFRKAWAFMSEMALLAEKLNHHPEWTNVYNRVDVVLVTHSAGGVTELDIRLAKAMDTSAGP